MNNHLPHAMISSFVHVDFDFEIIVLMMGKKLLIED